MIKDKGISDFYNWGKKVRSEAAFDVSLLAGDSSVYSSKLARFCALLTMTGYSLPWAENATQESGMYRCLVDSLGADNFECCTGTGSSEVDLSIASGTALIDGEEVYIVFLCLVGSHHGQWYNNFDCGVSEKHQGFSQCDAFAYGKLSEHIEKYCSDGKRIKLLITGHSRGAATAGFVAKHVTDDGKLAKPGDVFAYTFASPCYTREKDRSIKKYHCIKNIINEEDFITQCIPKKWGYGRYGMTYSLPNSENCRFFRELLGSIRSYYYLYTNGKTYSPYREGPVPVRKLVKVMGENVGTVEDYYGKMFRSVEGYMTLKDYFMNSLCLVAAEGDNPEKGKPGMDLIIKTFTDRTGSSPLFKTFADFFVKYEGLSGATNGRVSKDYFSQAHDMAVYCAIVTAADGKCSGGSLA